MFKPGDRVEMTDRMLQSIHGMPVFLRLTLVTPEGGKVARAAAVSPLIEAGNVYFAAPRFCPVGSRLHRGVRRISKRGS